MLRDRTGKLILGRRNGRFRVKIKKYMSEMKTSARSEGRKTVWGERAEGRYLFIGKLYTGKTILSAKQETIFGTILEKNELNRALYNITTCNVFD